MALVPEHVENTAQHSNEYRKFRHKYLPNWSKDDEESRCMNGDADFGFFCRRHHCRICGRIFCWKCSSKTIDVARFVKRVRVCDHCYYHYNSGSQERSDDIDASNSVLWIPNEWVPYCMCCADMFNWVRSREHCRKCGQVVCKQCSKIKQPVVELGFLRPVPVCKKCAEGNPAQPPATTGENCVLATTWREVSGLFYSTDTAL